MGRMFTAVFGAVAVTAAQDAFSILTSSSVPVLLHELRLSQNTDFGDAQDEGLRWNIKIGATVAGSGGTSVTPKNAQGNTATATVRANDTTPAGTGTIDTLLEDVFNVRAGLIWMPTPKIQEAFMIPVSKRLVIGLPSAPADSLTMSGTLIFEEMG